MIRKWIRSFYYGLRYIIYIPIFKLNHDKVSRTTRIAGDSSLKFCKIGRYNYIACRNSLFNVEVGNYCCFGPDVHIGGMQHSYWWYSMSPILSNQCHIPEKTVIGNDVWIGAGCIIKQGVKIGDGAVIGANSFVNKDVEPFAIVVGSPAIIIKYRFSKDIQDKIVESGYWNVDPKQAQKILDNLNLL